MNRFTHQILAVFLVLTAGTLSAQDGRVVTDIVATPSFLATILVGVMLAIGFQFLLTSLSVALGVSLTPNLKEAYVNAKTPNTRHNTDKDANNDHWNETNDASNLGVQVTSALGLWNVLTAALSLFFATWLALSLTPAPSIAISVTLALAIWSVFYLLMFYLEGRMAGTLIGTLINTAVSGLRAGSDAVKSIFTPSPASQVQTVADNTIAKLRQEMDATFDTNAITDAIDRFTNKLGDKVETATGNLGSLPSYDQIKADLKEVVSAGGSSSSPAKWTAIQGAIQTAIESNGKDKSEAGRSKVAQLKELYKEFSSNGDGRQGSGSSSGQGQLSQYVKKVQGYLNSATPDDFNTETLTARLKEFTTDPKGAAKDVLDQVKSVDKQTVVEAIAANTSLDKEQLNSYADRVSEVLTGLGTTVSDAPVQASTKANELLERLESSVAGFINSTDDRRLNYADLKGDFQRILSNPGESLDIVSARLKNYDRDTLVSVLTNNSRLSRQDIDKVVMQVEDARNTVSDQIQSIKDQANSAMNQAGRRAAIQAEHARKTAISASWWLFAAIVVSGVAAVAGSMTELF